MGRQIIISALDKLLTVALVFWSLWLFGCFEKSPDFTGVPCETRYDCIDRVCLDWWPEGYCSGRCETHQDCRQGDVCVAYEDGPYCFVACEDDCPVGYECTWTIGAFSGYCIPD